MSETAVTTDWTPEAVAAVRSQALEAQERLGITQAEMGRQVGRPGATLSAWLNGTYAGRNDAIAGQVQNWLRSLTDRARIRSGMPTAPGFLPLAAATQIVEVLHHAQHMPDLCVITGAPGIGKSTAACHYTRSNPNVWKLVAEPIHKVLRPFLEDLGAAMGLQGCGHADRRSRQITARVARSGGLIIIDEAQHLSSLCLDQLRTIHDKAEIGVALLGNVTVFGRLGGAGQAEYAQLHSRIGMKLKMRETTRRDIEAVLDAWGVEGSSQRSFLTAIARKPGALRKLTKTLKIAHMLAASADRPLSLDDIRTAHSQIDDTAIATEAAA